MGRRAKRRQARRQQRRPGILARAARFVRALFSSGPPDPRPDPPVGGVGVREPRRPLHPSASGAVALEEPPADLRDVWAVSEEDRS